MRVSILWKRAAAWGAEFSSASGAHPSVRGQKPGAQGCRLVAKVTGP